MSPRSIAPIATAVVALTAAAPAQALVNKVEKIDVPATVKAGKAFPVEFDLQFDKRTHQPPSAYLKAALLRTRGSAACPRALPMERKGWTTVLTHDLSQDPEHSVRIGVTGRDTLPAAGRYRYCGYIYTDTYTTTSLLPTHHVKTHASKLVRAR